MKKYIIILGFLIVACNPCKYVARHQECFAPDTIRETTIQTVHDTTTWIQSDSATFIALFYCDSANQVLIKSLNEYKSKGVETVIKYKDNRLQLRFYTDSILILNRYINTLKNKITYVKNPVNDQLQRDNSKLEKKLHAKKVFNRYLLIFSGISILVFAFLIWRKFG